MATTLLPAIFAICASLGVAKPHCTGGFAMNGWNQTDQSLWYNGSASWPNSKGKPSEKECRGATPIETYDIYDGTKGTTYACLLPVEDDHITDEELLQIKVLSKRLNSIRPKTMLDHQRAMELKHLVAVLVEQKP